MMTTELRKTADTTLSEAQVSRKKSVASAGGKKMLQTSDADPVQDSGAALLLNCPIGM